MIQSIAIQKQSEQAAFVFMTKNHISNRLKGIVINVMNLIASGIIFFI